MDICFQVYPKGSNHELFDLDNYIDDIEREERTGMDPTLSGNYRYRQRMDYFPNTLGFSPQITPAQSMIDLNRQAVEGLNTQINKIPDSKTTKDFGLYSAISTIGNIMNTAANDRIAMNASDNAVLGNAVSGNTIYDLFNNDKFYQGLDNVRNNAIDYSGVRNNYNLYNAWNPNNFQDTIHYAQKGGHQYAFGDNMNHAGSILGSTAELAGIGTMFGPIGTVVGAGLGAGMGVVNDIKNRRNRILLNKEIDKQNALQTENYYDTASLNDQRQLRNNMYNIFQQGGYMPNDNNITIFKGLKHGQFGLNGIPQGIASDGVPNYVEGGGFDKKGNPKEGEVRYKDYIYSARNTPSESLLKKYNLI